MHKPHKRIGKMAVGETMVETDAAGALRQLVFLEIIGKTLQ